MSVDVRDLATFYESALGAVARRLVGRVVAGYWPDLAGRSLAGLGYALPYLPALAASAERTLVLMPGRQGVVAWPAAGPSAACLVDPLVLPLPEGAIDRMLIVHALETAADAAELLHEAARALAPGGRAIVVCPNRRGLWARLDTTPFGQGQPYSRSQLRRLLRESFLAPARWAETLYVPPFENRLLLSGAGVWEHLGTGLSLPGAGVHVVEAEKQLHRPVPVRRRRRAERTRPILVPAPATSRVG